MRNLKSYVLVLALFTGCVTTHHKNVVETKNHPLAVSCGLNSSLSDGVYHMYSCTIENLQDNWLDVKIKSAEFADKEVKVSTSRRNTKLCNSISIKETNRRS